jgi:predicted nucleotidyltransferase
VKVIYLDREEVRKNVKRAVAALACRRPEIERVLLFGSLASGRAVPGSDADLLMILSRSDRSFLSRIPHYIPQGCGIAVDVFPYTYAELEAVLTAGNPFLNRALAEGIEIFRSPEHEQTSP